LCYNASIQTYPNVLAPIDTYPDIKRIFTAGTVKIQSEQYPVGSLTTALKQKI